MESGERIRSTRGQPKSKKTTDNSLVNPPSKEQGEVEDISKDIKKSTPSFAKRSRHTVSAFDNDQSARTEEIGVESNQSDIADTYFSKPDAFCDLKLIVSNGKELYVNKAILSAASPILHNTLKDVKDNTLNLETKRLEDIMQLLRHIYPQFQLVLSSDNVTPMMELAEEFEITNLQKSCRDFIFDRLRSISVVHRDQNLQDGNVENSSFTVYIEFYDGSRAPLKAIVPALCDWFRISSRNGDQEIFDIVLNILKICPSTIWSDEYPTCLGAFLAMSPDEQRKVLLAHGQLLESEFSGNHYKRYVITKKRSDLNMPKKE
ncbi:hypothetical protein SNEBB_001171 [Seison nebaliae]|nr:hypothetical protein SNEBB_001171 [Seison nebaliae]